MLLANAKIGQEMVIELWATGDQWKHDGLQRLMMANSDVLSGNQLC